MLRSIPLPLIALVGLLLAVDGILAWLAGATIWGWGVPWALGTGVLVGAFLTRLRQRLVVGLGAGVVVAVLLGVLLVFKGAAITAISLDTIPAILGFLLIFVSEIAIGIASILTGRASAQGANFWVYIVSGLAVVVLLNYLASRHVRLTFDMTHDKLESLSAQTLAKLKGLGADVHVLAFFRDSDPQRGSYADMLKKYAAASAHFSFEFIDPDKYPDVASRENVGPRGTPVIVKCEDRREAVTGTEEKDLTSAIIKVTRPGQKKFYFTSWHQEHPLESDLSALTNALRQLNYGVETIKLSDKDIPSDCAVLVIAGPKSPFLPIEVERLERYLAEGKSMLVMLDPDTNATGLEDLLAKYGAVVQPNLIIERQRGLVPYAGGLYMGEQQSTYARTTRYSSHAIVADMDSRGIAAGFYQAREVRRIPSFLDSSAVHSLGEAFVFAGTRMSFAETNVASALRNPRQAFDPEGMKTGPFSVAVAVTANATNPLSPEGMKMRLVVFGDSDFATNQGIGQERGNGDLIINTLNWLSEDEDLISIRPREPGSKPVHLTESQGTSMFLLSVWRYPAVIFVVGILIWWYRKNRGPTSQAE